MSENKKKESDNSVSRRDLLKTLPALGLAITNVGAQDFSNVNEIRNENRANAFLSEDDENELHLYMSYGGVPLSIWNELKGMARVVKVVIDNPKSAELFYSNPIQFLRLNGCSSYSFSADTLEGQMIMFFANPEVRKMVLENNVKAFVERLKLDGLLEKTRPSILESKMIASMTTAEKQVYEHMLDQLGKKLADVNKCSCIGIVCCAILAVFVSTVAVLVSYVAGGVVALSAAVFNSSVGPYNDDLKTSKKAISNPVLNQIHQISIALGGVRFSNDVFMNIIESETQSISDALLTMDEFKSIEPLFLKRGLANFIHQLLTGFPISEEMLSKVLR